MTSAKKNNVPQSANVSAIDLFCGVGGLTHGLQRGGIRVNAGIDIDRECKYPYEVNNKSIFINKDLANVNCAELTPLFSDSPYRLLAGCAPCQPFSTYNQKNSDEKWKLLKEFSRIILELQPDFVTMENVPKVVRHSIFTDFLKSLKTYHIWYDIVECTAYGVPQTRRRLILLASKHGKITLIPPTHKQKSVVTVRKAIGSLPPVVAGEKCASDLLHAAPRLSELNYKRIRQSVPGGTWRDWPYELVTDCHRRGTGETYPSVYGRMRWDEPAPTITTQFFGFGNGRFGHPEQDRAISIREAAILQTFPRKYKFLSKGQDVRFNVLGRLIGNAVPVRIGQVIAESIQAHMEKVC